MPQSTAQLILLCPFLGQFTSVYIVDSPIGTDFLVLFMKSTKMFLMKEFPSIVNVFTEALPCRTSVHAWKLSLSEAIFPIHLPWANPTNWDLKIISQPRSYFRSFSCAVLTLHGQYQCSTYQLVIYTFTVALMYFFQGNTLLYSGVLKEVGIKAKLKWRETR